MKGSNQEASFENQKNSGSLGVKGNKATGRFQEVADKRKESKQIIKQEYPFLLLLLCTKEKLQLISHFCATSAISKLSRVYTTSPQVCFLPVTAPSTHTRPPLSRGVGRSSQYGGTCFCGDACDAAWPASGCSSSVYYTQLTAAGPASPAERTGEGAAHPASLWASPCGRNTSSWSFAPCRASSSEQAAWPPELQRARSVPAASSWGMKLTLWSGRWV